VRMPVGGHDNAECLALKAEYKLNKDLKRFMKDFFKSNIHLRLASTNMQYLT
jgi:hypothetical protein